MSFPRYERYKGSGVEWLGEVPEHWQVLPLKRGYEVKLGKMLQPEPQSASDKLLPYLRAANIQWLGADIADVKQMWFSSEEDEALKLRRGDLLISEGGDVGRSTIWNDELPHCCFQNSVNRVRTKGADSNRFLYYWLSVMKDKEFIDALCNKSTIAHFTAEKVGAVPVPYPTRKEQESSAAVLDQETAKIDSLIEEQRRLIELLKEKRQAVISHAVTKGLSSRVLMKETGLPWVGEIPEHWDLLQLSDLIRPGSTITYGIVQAGPDIEGGIPYIRTSDLAGNQLPTEGYLRTSMEIDYAYRRSKVNAGDLVIALRSAVGKALLVPPVLEGANLTQGTAKFSPGSRCEVRYVGFFLNTAAKPEFDVVAKGATFKEVTLDKLRRITVCCPPLCEQKDIANFLEEEMIAFGALEREAANAVCLLQERRSALISAAVNGKIDVRNYTPKEAA